MKMSIHKFVLFGFSIFFACGSLTAITLWHSTHNMSKAIERLATSVESVDMVKSLQQDLSRHRRQALLHSINSPAERKNEISIANEGIASSLAQLTLYASNQNEKKSVQAIKNNIETYLRNYESFRDFGFRAENLYKSLSEDYYLAQESIQELMKLKLAEAGRFQAEASEENRLSYLFVTAAFLLLVLSLAALLIGIRKYFYQPIVGLRQMIETFEMESSAVVTVPKATVEIQEIALSFQKLSSRLVKQKETQLVFLASIAHDLKNPLGAIKMSTDLMEDDPSLSKQNQEILSIIGRQSHHMMRLISDLLDTTRIEAGNMDMKFASFDLQKIVSDAALLHSQMASLRNIEVQNLEYPLYTLCDEQRLAQVFNNLFNNAIKYSPEGSKIVTTYELSGEYVIVKISDCGVGILPEDIENIFEPFRRSSTTRTSIPGIGLGLSVARKIIRAHDGGDIFVTSKPGVGTTFAIRLRVRPQIPVPNFAPFTSFP